MSYRKILACVLLGVGCFNPETPPAGENESSSGSESTASGTLDTSASVTMGPATSTSPTTTTDSNDTTDSADTTDTSETTGPESCGGGAGLCVTVPDDWTGPVAVASAAPGVTPDCAGLEATVTANASLDAPAPICACDCSPAEGASCADALLAAYGADAACASDTVFTQVIDTDGGDPCNFIPGGVNTGEPPLVGAGYWTVTTTSAGGTCLPEPTTDIPAASYLASVSGCAAPELDMACDSGGSCFEAPDDSFAAGLCVWRAGAHDCPEGDFVVRSVHNRGDLVDERSCSECTCGDASGSCPTTEAQLFEGYYCNDASIAITSACTEACVGVGCETYAVSATVSIGAAEASCPPTGGELTGELVEQDPVTFCCTA